MEPPEKTPQSEWSLNQYHLPPELFISDGEPGSIVDNWVVSKQNIGGIHHLAYQVDNVEQQMEDWKEKGYATFTTEQPLKCPGLDQVFTNPHDLTGVIYEFIKRDKHGFCAENVSRLMHSTKDK